MSRRLDVYLADNEFARSRERAKELIKNGLVYVDGKKAVKPSLQVDEHCEVTVKGDVHDYVGRGALKLKYAFECFDVYINGKVCADIGASTGGFTQVMLENGAKKVYAIDVGHGQLADELAGDARVVNCEGTNMRDLSQSFFDEAIGFVAGDLSFISLELVVPVLSDIVCDNAEMVLLIKPQFEAGKKSLNKHGVVKDKKDHVRVLERLMKMFSEIGLEIKGLTPSGIRGGDGNIEYLVWLGNESEQDHTSVGIDIKDIVDRAFRETK